MARGRAVLACAGSRVLAGTACPSRPACRVTLSASLRALRVPGAGGSPPAPLLLLQAAGGEKNCSTLPCQLQHGGWVPTSLIVQGITPRGCLQAPSEGLAVPAALRCPQGRQFAATEKAEVWFWGCTEPGVPGGLGMCAPPAPRRAAGGALCTQSLQFPPPLPHIPIPVSRSHCSAEPAPCCGWGLRGREQPVPRGWIPLG